MASARLPLARGDRDVEISLVACDTLEMPKAHVGALRKLFPRQSFEDADLQEVAATKPKNFVKAHTRSYSLRGLSRFSLAPRHRRKSATSRWPRLAAGRPSRNCWQQAPGSEKARERKLQHVGQPQEHVEGDVPQLAALHPLEVPDIQLDLGGHLLLGQAEPHPARPDVGSDVYEDRPRPGRAHSAVGTVSGFGVTRFKSPLALTAPARGPEDGPNLNPSANNMSMICEHCGHVGEPVIGSPAARGFRSGCSCRASPAFPRDTGPSQQAVTCAARPLRWGQTLGRSWTVLFAFALCLGGSAQAESSAEMRRELSPEPNATEKPIFDKAVQDAATYVKDHCEGEMRFAVETDNPRHIQLIRAGYEEYLNKRGPSKVEMAKIKAALGPMDSLVAACQKNAAAAGYRVCIWQVRQGFAAGLDTCIQKLSQAKVTETPLVVCARGSAKKPIKVLCQIGIMVALEDWLKGR